MVRIAQKDIGARVELSKNFDRQFERGVRDEIFRFLVARKKDLLTNIKVRMGNRVRTALMESNVYESLAGGGQLQAELGVPDPAERLNTIIETWVANIVVVADFRKTPRGFGKINIGIFRQGWDDVLNLEAAEYISDKGRPVEWLRWLLLEGSRSIILDYEFQPSFVVEGRTGLGIMVKKDGARWSVPAEFAGAEEDNFAIRALEDLAQDVEIALRQEITKSLQ